MTIELLSVPDCPNVDQVRGLLQDCLRRMGIRAEIVERTGDYASPTVLIDGVDVMGTEPGTGGSCRLDLPTADRITAALRAAGH